MKNMDKDSKLKMIRKAKGMTQGKLAEKTGIPLRTIQDLEADKVMHITTTRADYLYKICKALNIKMEDIMENNKLNNAIIKLYDYLDMDIDSVDNDMEHGYLTENDGYYWYFDGNKEAKINISTLEITDSVEEEQPTYTITKHTTNHSEEEIYSSSSRDEAIHKYVELYEALEPTNVLTRLRLYKDGIRLAECSKESTPSRTEFKHSHNADYIAYDPIYNFEHGKKF